MADPVIHYDLYFVGLSYVISVLGSYTALQLAIAIPQAQDVKSIFTWVIGAAVALGGGAIWSMHFIGMNAADMGVPVYYDAFRTFASLVIGVIASGWGLLLVGRGLGSTPRLLFAGVCTGLGVAWMHYTGMAAMIMPATIEYDQNLFLASLVIGVVASTVALWLAFNLRGNLQRFGSAIVMGVAVCGMHYTGMYAVQMKHTGQTLAPSGLTMPASLMAYSVFAVSAVVLVLLLFYSAWRSQRVMVAV